ncbi:peptidoglycan editing factor PgeF [Solimonas fluminis]|uniref:Purine nucleoside phosphorylase n=1 Tax=Solimonas fluminis TaxID=2086571 RepID=A0A2S5TIB1_9GAMM|nr:peptidoglycan editing factor PgeF [Solimonas fluminis]PPE74726.1 peptidoglycan editing factor PgeF [Solimonas fluminis]
MTLPPEAFLHADWPAPPGVRALQTTRLGGSSQGPYGGFNLASHCGDDPAAVARNRALLRESLALPAEPAWLNQVHGCAVARAPAAGLPSADAGVAEGRGQVCVVLTADCLPVLFCAEDGSAVAAAHAGWRGLAGGVLEATVAALQRPPGRLLAWMGAAIGPASFEVGPEVREAFVAQDADAAACFRPGRPGKLQADLYALARLRLRRAGVERIHGGGLCTVEDARRFFSFRREPVCGRMASLIWIGS